MLNIIKNEDINISKNFSSDEIATFEEIRKFILVKKQEFFEEKIQFYGKKIVDKMEKNNLHNFNLKKDEILHVSTNLIANFKILGLKNEDDIWVEILTVKNRLQCGNFATINKKVYLSYVKKMYEINKEIEIIKANKKYVNNIKNGVKNA